MKEKESVDDRYIDMIQYIYNLSVPDMIKFMEKYTDFICPVNIKCVKIKKCFSKYSNTKLNTYEIYANCIFNNDFLFEIKIDSVAQRFSNVIYCYTLYILDKDEFDNKRYINLSTIYKKWKRIEFINYITLHC